MPDEWAVPGDTPAGPPPLESPPSGPSPGPSPSGSPPPPGAPPPPGTWSPPGSWGPPGWPGEPGQPPTGRTEGLAIAAFVLGLVSLLFCPIITAIIGLVLAAKAHGRINQSGGTLGGRGLATA